MRHAALRANRWQGMVPFGHTTLHVPAQSLRVLAKNLCAELLSLSDSQFSDPIMQVMDLVRGDLRGAEYLAAPLKDVRGSFQKYRLTMMNHRRIQ